MTKKLGVLWEQTIAILERKRFKLSLILIIVAYFVLSLTSGLIKGGRWDLYQNIAIADRFLNGKGFYYSAIEASSPYFPGVAFLAVFIGKFFAPWRDYILLIIASAIGTAFFYVLVKLGEKFSGNKWVSLLLTTGLLFSGFDSYRSYMNEFKADSLILLVGVLLVYIIEKFENDKEKIDFKHLIFVFILAFVMDVTKQQALYIDIALGLYLVFTKRFFISEKIKILAILVLAGIFALIVVFSIADIEIQVIKNLSDMPYWSIKSIISQMSSDFKKHIVYFVLLFFFVMLVIMKKINMTDMEKKWLLISIIFGCAQIVGGWKSGGNCGNYEVGMITFLPFVIVAAEYLFSKYIVYKKQVYIIAICDIVMLCSTIEIYVYVSYKGIPSVINRINNDMEVSIYLSENFEGETMMYYSNQYMQIARSSVNPGMDVYTVPGNIEKYWDIRAEYLQNQIYKYLYINREDLEHWDIDSMIYFNHESRAAEILDEYYILVEDPDMPKSLQGQLYVAR